MGQKENINQRKVVGLIDQMKVPTRGRDLKMVIRSLAKPLLIVPEGSLLVVAIIIHMYVLWPHVTIDFLGNCCILFTSLIDKICLSKSKYCFFYVTLVYFNLLKLFCLV